MRPAIYLLKGEKRAVIAMSPTMFGLLIDREGCPCLAIDRSNFPVKGSVSEFIFEQEAAMRDVLEGSSYRRLAELFKGEVSELLADIQAEIVEGQAAMVWPDGRYKLINDDGNFDEDMEVIAGINVVDEGVFVYGYTELQMWGNLVDELVQNFIDSM
jgi:hypothetical protein